MTPEEEQYYKQLQISRARDMQKQKEKAREEIAGKAAGQAAVAAASAAYGIGKIPVVKTAIKKVGEAAGKKVYRRRKIIILLIIFLPIILWTLFIILAIATAYATLCYSAVGWMASKILGLWGVIYCP